MKAPFGLTLGGCHKEKPPSSTMKSFLRPIVCALALGSVFVSTPCFADYQHADTALERLEGIVTLTPAQAKQALQVFQDLKDIMDSISPEERPTKGMPFRQDAVAAIREILTPEQQAIYDRTPQRLGGAGKAGDPAMQALRAKIRGFVRRYVQNSTGIATQVGTIQTVAVAIGGDTTVSSGDNLHPEGGTNLVRVVGSSGAGKFKIAWTMDESGEMTVTGVTALTN
jgi:hypothetical protein